MFQVACAVYVHATCPHLRFTWSDSAGCTGTGLFLTGPEFILCCWNQRVKSRAISLIKDSPFESCFLWHLPTALPLPTLFAAAWHTDISCSKMSITQGWGQFRYWLYTISTYGRYSSYVVISLTLQIMSTKQTIQEILCSFPHPLFLWRCLHGAPTFEDTVLQLKLWPCSLLPLELQYLPFFSDPWNTGLCWALSTTFSPIWQVFP